MEQNIVESPHMLSAWTWAEKNKKQIVLGVAGVAVVGLVIGYTSWSRSAKLEAASFAMSDAFFAGNRMTPAEAGAAYGKIGAEFGSTPSGQQAKLFAATALFNEGKFSEAQSAFEQFARDHATSPMSAQAFYGSGAALVAQGKTAEAAAAYKSVVDRYPQSPITQQARYSLAGMLVQQGDLTQAITLYEAVARDAARSSLGAEAALRADELHSKLPPPTIPAADVSTNGPASNAVPVKN